MGRREGKFGMRNYVGSSQNLGERAAWGRVCGRAKLLAGTLRCLHLCWRLPWDWSDEEQLGRCPKHHKGRCPLTLQGADEKGRSPPLTPFAIELVALSCSFRVQLFGASPKPLFAPPQLSVKNHYVCALGHEKRPAGGGAQSGEGYSVSLLYFLHHGRSVHSPHRGC